MPEKPLIPVTAPSGDKVTKPDQEPVNGQSSSSKTKRLDGITSIDEKVFLECEILAHVALSKITSKMSTEAKAAIDKARDPSKRGDSIPPATVILLDNTLISALQLFSSLKLQSALFEKSFNGVAPLEPAPRKELHKAFAPGLAISAVTGAVGGVLDLLGLFRQDTQFSGRTVAIKETALYLEVAHALQEAGCKVLYPRLLSFQADEDAQLSEAKLTQLFDDVFRARQGAANRLRPRLQEVSGFEKDLIDREREFPTATPERQKQLTQEIQDLKARLVTARKNLDPDLVLFENTDSSWNQLQKALAIPDEKTGQVPMQLLNRAAESIERFKCSPPAYFLYAEGVVAGGTMRVRRTLWQTLFWGDGLEFSGGSVVSYALFDGKAQILTSGTHRYMTNFRSFQKDAPVWGNFNSCT
jgi:hypothetical protein